MQLRYDGYFGFPGGLIDANEDFVNAVNREMAEEMNLDINLHSVTNDDHVISHWSERKNLALHFYKLKVTMTELIEIEKRALLAQDYGSEVIILIHNFINITVNKYIFFLFNRCLELSEFHCTHWVIITADFQCS